MHDPYQNYQTFGQPFGGQQFSPFNNPGITGYGTHPQQLQQLQLLQQLQQLQLLQQLQGQAQIPGQGYPFPQNIGPNPMTSALQHPLLQHPLAAAALQHQWINPQLQNSQFQNPQFQNPQLQNPMLAYQGWPQQQVGYPLAPQSLIGGGPYGGNPAIGNPAMATLHPLAAQMALRTLGAGISPFGF